MRLDGTTESLVFEGALDREMFEAYIIKILAPTLHSGDIVIMDNLNAHKSQICRDEISKYQAEVINLPPYSPDLNPIEKMWSKLKQLIRGAKPRTQEALINDTKIALKAITAEDAKGWFGLCEYTISQY